MVHGKSMIAFESLCLLWKFTFVIKCQWLLWKSLVVGKFTVCYEKSIPAMKSNRSFGVGGCIGKQTVAMGVIWFYGKPMVLMESQWL
jgi:hypothetical protein